MLNFNFIKSQFKIVWITVLSFLVVFTLLIALANVFPVLGEKREIGEGFSSYSQGASLLLNMINFGFGSFVIFLAFGIAMSTILINKDINRGYIVSWITASVPRKSIFNSKLFIIIISTLIINFWIVTIEMASFSIRMEDFKPAVGHLLLGNLSLLCFSLMIVSGTWIIFSIFRKNSVALGILLGFGVWCGFSVMLNNLSVFSGLENLKYFKYFTVQSLFNSPLKFADFSSDSPKGVEYAKILPIKVLDYVWQLPLMIGVSIGLFTCSQFILKNKDFSF